MQKKILDYKKNSIYYRVTGTGNPVIFIHGFGETGDVWKNQIEFLKNQFQLIIPDLPGSGKSELIDDMSMEGMAELIKVILDKECFKVSSATDGGDAERVSVSIIGHSMGGYITLAFAEKYSSCLNAFGLFHSTAYADTEEKKVTRQKGIEFMKQHGGFEFLKTATPNLFSQYSKDRMKDLIDEFIASLSNFKGEALVKYYQALMQRPDRTSVLKQVNLPVLFVFGEYDTAVPLNDGLQQCHLPEKSYIHILQNSGHMGMMEEPEKSNQILKEFLINVKT